MVAALLVGVLERGERAVRCAPSPSPYSSTALIERKERNEEARRRKAA
jgi:hypothetical protein